MEKILVAVIFVMFATNVAGFNSCGMSRQIYDVKGNVTLDLGVGGEDKTEVIIAGQVFIEQLENYTQLQVMELSMTDYKENIYTNPIGIEKPVKIVIKNSGSFSLIPATSDSISSIAIKQRIINLLPRQAILKAADNPSLTKIKATQDLLKRGDQEIVLRDDYKELIVVLGNTGAGKSTLTQWIAGDSSRLEAKEVVEGEYIIGDNLDRIGNSTIDSKTTFPELIIDVKNNEAYYDFPGFSDTRDSSYDIATSYFIKRTLDHASAVKLLFVVSYPSVRKGVDRQDFLKLLRHLSELVKDMNKFQKSIAFAVTKVDNQIVIRRGIPTLVDDTKIIAGIAHFLEEAKNDLQNRFSTINPSSKDVTFYKNSITFIDAILEQKEKQYTRIAIFRRPSEPGPLSEMTTLQGEKEKILNMMHRTLKYTEKLPDDFGRTVADRSKNDINDLIQEIDKNILFSTCAVAEKLNKYFVDLKMQLSTIIKETNTIDIAVADKHLKHISNLFSNFTNSFYIVEELTNTIKNIKNNEDVSQLIFKRLTILKLPAVDDSTKEMMTQGRYLEFLQSISNTESNSRLSSLAWASSFQNILTNQSVTLSHTQNDIKNIETEILKRVEFEVTKIGNDLVELFSKEEENLHDIHEVLGKIRFFYNKMNNAVSIDNTADYIHNVLKITTDFKINTSEGVRIYLTRDGRYFDQLKSVINNVIEYLYDSQFWYKFLNRLHEQLLSYKIQKESSKFYELFKKTYQPGENKIVSETGFEALLLAIFDQEYKPIYETVKNITLDRNKINNLGKVFSVTLKRPDHLCTGGKMIIEGTVIKASDILQVVCPYEVSLVAIYAASKVIIDSDLKQENKDLLIMSPTWEIQGKRNIKLLGKSGRPHWEPKAENGQYDSENGKDGEPGLPGHRGGDFWGLGKTFINSEHLTIYSIGGTGGPGQDGGDGANGADGERPIIENPKQYLKDKGWFNDRSRYTCSIFCLYSQYQTVETSGCTNGGRPGLGGAGGLGGYSGKIHILTTNNDHYNIKIETSSGDEGEPGSKGREGRAGKPGKYVNCDWAFFRFGSQTKCSVENTRDCSDGDEILYFSGVNSENQQFPVSYSMNVVNYVTTVNEFKHFLSGIYNDTVTTSDLNDFVSELENSRAIDDMTVSSTSVSDEVTNYYKTDKTEIDIASSTNIDVSFVETTTIDIASSTNIDQTTDVSFGETTTIDIASSTNIDQTTDVSFGETTTIDIASSTNIDQTTDVSFGETTTIDIASSTNIDQTTDVSFGETTTIDIASSTNIDQTTDVSFGETTTIPFNKYNSIENDNYNDNTNIDNFDYKIV